MANGNRNNTRTENKKTPAGSVYFLIEGEDENDKTKWIEAGPAWENQDGSLSFELVSEPLAWRNPRTRRMMQLRFRRES